MVRAGQVLRLGQELLPERVARAVRLLSQLHCLAVVVVVLGRVGTVLPDQEELRELRWRTTAVRGVLGSP